MSSKRIHDAIGIFLCVTCFIAIVFLCNGGLASTFPQKHTLLVTKIKQNQIEFSEKFKDVVSFYSLKVPNNIVVKDSDNIAISYHSKGYYINNVSELYINGVLVWEIDKNLDPISVEKIESENIIDTAIANK